MFLGNCADLYGRTGEIDLARDTINRQLEGLTSIADSSVFIRRSTGDALLSAAFIEAQSIGDAEIDGATRLEETLNKSKAAFEKAKAQFDQMEKDGIGSQATRNQTRIATDMIKYVEEQIAKIHQVPDDQDF